MRTCELDGCSRPHYGRGMCQTHWARLTRYGRLDVLTDTERFWAKVDKGDGSGCWLWTGTGRRYGRVKRDGTPYLAHRVAYEMQVGPIPDGLQVNHLCRVTKCVRGDHLEVTTASENQRYRHAVKTHCPHGHPYDAENTYIDGDGNRRCKTCNRDQAREYQRRRRAA